MAMAMKTLFSAVVLSSVFFQHAFALTDIVIGLLEEPGSDRTARAFAPTFEKLLNETVGNELNMSFQLLSLPFTNLTIMAETGQLDFVFTHPAVYSCLESVGKMTALVTLREDKRGYTSDQGGGLIFSRHDRYDMRTVYDFSGKTVSAVAPGSLLGMQAQLYLLESFGIEVLLEAHKFFFTRSDAEVVYDVLNGVADVGFVPSGVVEAMISEGVVFMTDFFFINEQHHVLPDGTIYPHKTSTPLYPSWLFAAHPKLNKEVQEAVLTTLLAITDESEVAVAGRYHSWIPARSYLAVHSLEVDLGLITESNLEYSCANLLRDQEALICPYSYVVQADIICSDECPGTELGESRSCICDPCAAICSEHSSLQLDGSCTCNDGTTKWGNKCEKMSVVLIETLVPTLVVLVVLFLAYGQYQRQKADRAWQIEADELKFPEPVKVLGTGSFGVVLKASYRGTNVAVKRALPPKRRSRIRSHNKTGIISGGGNGTSAWTGAATSVSKKSQREGVEELFDRMEQNQSVHSGDSIGHVTKTSGTTAVSNALCFWRNANQAQKSLKREIGILNRLQHPNICSMIGVVIGRQGLLLVLEYLELGSLHGLLHNQAMELDGTFIFQTIQDIVNGMRFLHASNIVHGDLKSMNCLVDGKFHVKVSDFGMASTTRSIRGGTPYFMAPEIIKGEACSPASDVYSFAITMFEIFSRQDPYEEIGEMAQEDLARGIVQGRLRPTLPDTAPFEFAGLYKECIHGDAERRPSFDELERRTSVLESTIKVAESRHASKLDEGLLEEVFPKHIAAALREGRVVEPEQHEEVTIFFSDICGFTNISSTLEPIKVSNMLHRLYTEFDRLSSEFELYKVETIGDAYMCVSNLFTPQHDHAARVGRFSLAAVKAANSILIDPEEPEKGHIDIRVGFHSGAVVSNVVGTKSPRFCLFGSTVNVSSRMESNSEKNRVHLSDDAAKLLRLQDSSLILEKRKPTINVKGIGKMTTYWLLGDENVKQDPLPDVVEGVSNVNEDTLHSAQAVASLPQKKKQTSWAADDVCIVNIDGQLPSPSQSSTC